MPHHCRMANTRKRVVDPEAKQKAILDAAERLFAKQGYSQTSTTLIASQAGVAVGTIFKYFPDKATLLSALHQRIEQQFVDALVDAWAKPADCMEVKLGNVFTAMFTTAGRIKDIMPVLSMSIDTVTTEDYQPGQQMRQTIGDMLAEGVLSGGLKSHNTEHSAFLMHGLVEGALRCWMQKPSAAHQKELISTLLSITRTGLLANSKIT